MNQVENLLDFNSADPQPGAKYPSGFASGGKIIHPEKAPWQAKNKPPEPPEPAFMRAMAEHGLNPGEIIADGELQRFDAEERGDSAGWYVLYLDGVPAGCFGNWKTSLKKKWCAKKESEMSPEERSEHKNRMADINRQREEKQRIVHEAARERLLPVYEKAGPASPDHPYLKRKKVKPYDGIRQTGNILLVPLLDENGQYWSHQEIYPEKRPFGGGKPRDKNIPKGARKKGCSFTIPGNEKIYLCEGYSTGASIHDATGGTVICCVDAGNLLSVAKKVREKLLPTASITVCADDDKWKPENGNPGREKAEKAGKEINARVIFPTFKSVSGKPTDWNDLAVQEGVEAVRTQIVNGINSQGGGQPGGTSQSFCIDDFVLNGLSTEMEKQMLEDKFILGRLAILGQMTVIYAAPNTGKTLLTIWGLIEKIKTGEINAKNIYYINADDNFKGLTQKLKLAEQYGFNMLAPGHAMPGKPVLKAGDMSRIFDSMIKAGATKGRILVLDTYKKFSSLMDKERGSGFNQTVRNFVSHSGSAILLAHVNKYRDAEKKVIYAGTTDLKEDADCSYTLDTISEDSASGTRTVKFENIKNRGDVDMEAIYQYDFRPETPYFTKLKSIAEVNEAELKKIEKRIKLDERFKRNLRAIEAIAETLKSGICEGKVAIVKETVERSELNKKYIETALVQHTGTRVREFQFWKLTIGERGTQIYELNPEASW